jgi:hypothetical protein
MMVIIELDQRDPPRGTIRVRPAAEGPDGSPGDLVFGGWLGLVGTLYELLGTRPEESRRGG